MEYSAEEIDAIQQAAYAEGRSDEARDSRDALAGKLIDKWVETHSQPIPWKRAVEIVSIVTKLSDAERNRLQALD